MQGDAAPKAADEIVCILFETPLGRIVAEIYLGKAPVTCANFLSYVDSGLYENATFYRTMRPGAGSRPNRVRVVQGGIDQSCRNPPLPPIPLESTDITGLKHEDGVLSLARWEPDTGASEFFVVVGEGGGVLDFGAPSKPDMRGFAAFGRIVEGMEIVRRTNEAPAGGPTTFAHMEGQVLTEPLPLRISRL